MLKYADYVKNDIFVHVCCNSQYSFEIQNIWWDLIIENFCLELYLELSSYEDEVLYQILLGKLCVPI
jgi:hypothetical protein